jgi:alpha-glucoside transport system substrate-binding protein
MIQIMQTAEILRFDGSDLMPAAVGAGTFWTEGTSFVNGDKTAAEATAAIEDSWPEG